MKFMILMNDSNMVICFRKTLISVLIKQGHEVLVCATDNRRENDILNLGSKFSYFNYSNRSISIAETLKYQNHIKRQINLFKPDRILTFQVKPNIFGLFAAKTYVKKHKLKVISMVEGLGDPFVYKTFKWNLIRFIECILYRMAFKYAALVYFLNKDDANEFVKRKIVNKSKVKLMNGIGVETNKFIPLPFPNFFTVGYPCRLLKNKGILEYCQLASLVHKKNKNINFILAGPEGNVQITQIQKFIDTGDIQYLGPIKDMPYFYSNITITVTTSYREGFPTIVMESMSCGRPVVAFDVVGCRDAIMDHRNGFLVPNKNIEEMSEKILMLSKNQNLLQKMSKSARQYAINYFNAKKIQEEYIENVSK